MYVDYKFMKIKKRLKILWAGGIENGFGYTVHRTLKSYLKNESMEWIDLHMLIQIPESQKLVEWAWLKIGTAF